MSFPLGEWIDDHSDLPHNLGISGMRGSLDALPATLGTVRAGAADELAARLSRRLKVAPERLVLTSGATEANSLALWFLYREIVRRTGRAPRVRSPRPDYPVLADAAVTMGYRLARGNGPADVVVFSDPNNPMGSRASRGELTERSRGCRATVVDETFREFTLDPSLARDGPEGLWVTGSFTKVYGADDVRIGYAVAPARDFARFNEFLGVLHHQLPPSSIGAALTILDHRTELLREARGLFRRNLAELRRSVPRIPELRAPLWFDRGDGVLPGDMLARRAVDAGVLVCSGSFFGDPTGVRVCLTRRTFPEDLRAYLEVRAHFL